MSLILVPRRLMFLSFFFLQAFSDEEQRSNQTIMQTTGHFEYVYGDKYFYNSWMKRKKQNKIVYFFTDIS